GPQCGELFTSWNELQRDAVVAVAQTGWLRTVVEDVTLVTAAARAMILGTRIDQLVIRRFADASGNDVEKARPAGAAFELLVGIEERQVTTRADELAVAMFIEQRARSRIFGILLAEHAVLLFGQQFLPLS